MSKRVQLLLMLVFSFSAGIGHATNSDNNSESAAQTCARIHSGGSDEEIANCIKMLTSADAKNSSNDICATLQTAIYTAKKDYKESCTSITSDCFNVAMTCACKGKADTDANYCNKITDDIPEASVLDSNGKPIKTDKETRKKTDALAICPNLAGAKLDKLKESEEKSKDKVDALKVKLSDKKQRAKEIQAEIETAKKELESKTQEINQNTEEAINDEKAKFADAQKKATALYNQMNDAITKQIEDDSQANNDKLNQLHSLENDCYQKGLAGLQAYLADRNAHLSTSTLSGGSFGQLLGTVGPARRDKNTNVAYYGWPGHPEYPGYQGCMTDTAHKNATDSINRAFAKHDSDIKHRIEAIQRDQKKLMDDNFGAAAQNAQQVKQTNIIKKAQTSIAKAQADTQNSINSKYPELNALLGKSAQNPCSQSVSNNMNCAAQMFSDNSKTSKGADAAGADGLIAQLELELAAAQKQEASNLTLFKTAEDLSNGVPNDKAASLSTNWQIYIDSEINYAKTCCLPSKTQGASCGTVLGDVKKVGREAEITDTSNPPPNPTPPTNATETH